MDNSYPTVDQRLILAYEQTVYVVQFGEDEELIIRIGELHPALDAWLKLHKAEDGASSQLTIPPRCSCWQKRTRSEIES